MVDHADVDLQARVREDSIVFVDTQADVVHVDMLPDVAFTPVNRQPIDDATLVHPDAVPAVTSADGDLGAIKSTSLAPGMLEAGADFAESSPQLQQFLNRIWRLIESQNDDLVVRIDGVLSKVLSDEALSDRRPSMTSTLLTEPLNTASRSSSMCAHSSTHSDHDMPPSLTAVSLPSDGLTSDSGSIFGGHQALTTTPRKEPKAQISTVSRNRSVTSSSSHGATGGSSTLSSAYLRNSTVSGQSAMTHVASDGSCEVSCASSSDLEQTDADFDELNERQANLGRSSARNSRSPRESNRKSGGIGLRRWSSRSVISKRGSNHSARSNWSAFQSVKQTVGDLMHEMPHIKSVASVMSRTGSATSCTSVVSTHSRDPAHHLQDGEISQASDVSVEQLGEDISNMILDSFLPMRSSASSSWSMALGSMGLGSTRSSRNLSAPHSTRSSHWGTSGPSSVRSSVCGPPSGSSSFRPGEHPVSVQASRASTYSVAMPGIVEVAHARSSIDTDDSQASAHGIESSNEHLEVADAEGQQQRSTVQSDRNTLPSVAKTETVGDVQNLLHRRTNEQISSQIAKDYDSEDQESNRPPIAATAALLLLRICGIVPWSNSAVLSRQQSWRKPSVWYQWFAVLTTGLCCVLSVLTIVRRHDDLSSDQGCNTGTCHLSESLVHDVALSFGSFLGLVVAVNKRNAMGASFELFHTYGQYEQFRDRWLRMVLRDMAITLLLWIVAVAERVRGLRSFYGTGHVQNHLHAVSFSVSSLVLFALAYLILYFCRGMMCAVDAFCMHFVKEGNLQNAVPRWNVVQAVLRKSSGTLHGILCALQSTLCVMLMCVCVYVYQNWQAEDAYVYLIIPAVLLVLGVARIFIKAAEVTERCMRVPSLVNACSFGSDMDVQRQYLVQYIHDSDAGFYVFKVRVTSAATIKFAHFCGVAIFAMLTQILR